MLSGIKRDVPDINHGRLSLKIYTERQLLWLDLPFIITLNPFLSKEFQIFMEQSKIDAGTITALMIRMKEIRLPRATRMLDRVNRGEKLRDSDIQFLKRVYNDSRGSLPLVQRHPEYHELISRVIDLYTEIITKGLENEKSG
jgi:hypothetical protein